jgi:hypothetical protein
MKTKMFLGAISIVIMCSCSKTTKPDYVYLNADQLKPLGIELNEKGVFYKNENPNWKQDKEKYECLAFYCTTDNYVSSKQFNSTDTLKATNSTDSIIKQKDLTKYDFYPILIGDTKGKQSIDRKSLPNDMKLLPVAICMAETNLPNRKDTVIVWLKPTESLKKALPATINMDEYLRTRPANM